VRRPSLRSAPSRAAAAAVAVALALFGGFLLALTPSLDDRPGLQTVWVVFCLVLLKVPLLLLVWWLIVQRRSGRERRWSEQETIDFLSRVSGEATRWRELPDPAPRLEQLRRDAWAAVERGDEGMKPALVELALRVDGLRRAAAVTLRSS
jgi:hypothetical protein